MRQLICSFLLFAGLFLPTSIYAVHEGFSRLSLENCDPDCLIEQKINSTTGELLLDQTDACVLGPEPIILKRRYRSSDGWNFFPHTLLVLGDSSEKTGYTQGNVVFRYVKAFCGERSGSILTYTGWISDTVDGHLLTVKNGLVNCMKGEIGGRTNVRNKTLHYRCKTDQIELTCGDGSKCTYQKILVPACLDVLDGPIYQGNFMKNILHRSLSINNHYSIQPFASLSPFRILRFFPA